MPVKITILVSTLVIGGAEQLLLDLLDNIDRQRFQVDLIFLRKPGVVGQEILNRGFPFRQDVLRSRLDLLAPFRLASILREQGTEILFIINHLNALLYGVPAARLAGIKAVVNWHNETNRRYPLHGLTMLVRRMFHLSVDSIVAAAKGHKEYIVKAEGVPPGKVTVIYNGVNTATPRGAYSSAEARQRLGLPETAPTVAIVAALRPDKAHEVFLQAARLVVREVENAVFLVVGDGPRRQALEALSRELGLGHAVHFLGFRRDVPDILAATDIFAISSYPWQETLSVAMLEAMAAGIPAVVTDVGFLDEVVREGVNGYLVPPGDPAALAERLVALLRDRALLERMGAEAIRSVQEKCSVETMAAGFEELFQELAGNPRGSQ